MGRVAEFFRRLIRKKKEASIMEHDMSHRVECDAPQAMEHSVAQHDAVQHSEPMVSQDITLQRRRRLGFEPSSFVKRAGSQASRQPIGRFMKHGHQASWYRKSVKAKVKPEEEENS